MALRNQPYIPLYVQDFQTDEKLIECSAETTGVYIRLLCVMHKSDQYGTFLLKQNGKQDNFTCFDFAKSIVKYMPYSVEVIESALQELLLNKVIQQENDKLLQKRMILDNELSIKRAVAGKKGGTKTQLALSNALANTQANTENENEVENEIESLYDLSLILDLLRAELPEINLTNGIINSVVFDTVNRFVNDLPEFEKIEAWREYIEKIKKSDWLMKRTDKHSPLSLKFLCNPDSVLQAYSGTYNNHKTGGPKNGTGQNGKSTSYKQPAGEDYPVDLQ